MAQGQAACTRTWIGDGVSPGARVGRGDSDAGAAAPSLALGRWRGKTGGRSAPRGSPAATRHGVESESKNQANRSALRAIDDFDAACRARVADSALTPR